MVTKDLVEKLGLCCFKLLFGHSINVFLQGFSIGRRCDRVTAHDCFGHVVGQEHDTVLVHCEDLHTRRLVLVALVSTDVARPECVQFLLLILQLGWLDIGHLNLHLSFLFRGLVIGDQGAELIAIVMGRCLSHEALGPVALFWLRLRAIVLDLGCKREDFWWMVELFHRVLLV